MSFFSYTLFSSLEMGLILEAGAIISFFCSIYSACLTCYLIFVKQPLSDMVYT